MKKWLLLGLLCLGAGDPYLEIERLVRENFYDRSLRGLNWSHLCRQQAKLGSSPRLINALLEQLKASHTRFYAADSQAFHELCGIFPALKLAAPYRGVGWFLMESPDRRYFIKNLWPGFPAAEAGLRVGDEILDVDGRSPLEVDHLRGKNLALVSVRRQADAQPHLVSVAVRAIDPIPAFLEVEKKSGRLLGKTAYVAIPCYAGQQFQDTLAEMLSQGPLSQASGLILDLRDGWGGADPAFLNMFNQRLPVLELEFPDGKRTDWDRQWRKPVVLLVNRGTTSGKEIYAYGLQKYGLGKVVGERTAGAVLAGRPYVLSSGGLLYLAVADARVDGQRLEGRGVTPDVEVARPIPYCGGADPQLEAALALLDQMYTK
ncbi:PDZ domain-containing protein [bacterium]|nr:PDZ domain-containing protein [bacterium]